MAVSKDFLDFVREQLAPLGTVTSRRMFGAAGVYIDGTIMALLSDDELYFKCDDTTRPAFEAEGCGPFTYATKDGEHALTSYWRAPERLFDDPDVMQAFARDALAVSRRAATQKMRPAKHKTQNKRPA